MIASHIQEKNPIIANLYANPWKFKDAKLAKCLDERNRLSAEHKIIW